MEFTKEQLKILISVLKYTMFSIDMTDKFKEECAELLSDIYDEIGESE